MGVLIALVNFLLWLILRNLTIILVFATFFLLTKHFINSCQRPSPPGPWGLPIVGYLPFLGTAVHETFHKLSEKYGPILQLSLGVKKVVVLSDPEIIRQTFKKEELTGRPDNKLYEMFQGYGVINIAGNRWKEQRRFLHEHLRALGMKFFGPGREHMETIIKNEVKTVLEKLASHKGEAISVENYLKNASANVVCSMMMSVTFENDNPIFKRFMELHKQGFELFMKADIANYIPIYRYSADVKKCVKQLHENRNESLQLLKGFVNKRRENFEPEFTRDIIDAYLHEEYTSKLEGTPKDVNYDCQLLQVMCDLFSAGQETVSLCLNWCLIHLLHNKNVLNKIQEELDTVIGRSRLPCLDDMPSLPYIEATICEVLRISNVVPLATPHSTTNDTYIGKYFIPKGTTVFPNLYSCHMNSRLWNNPDVFDPTRFLDDNGKVSKPKEFLPFGVGRRMCLGEVMARSEVFLFITSIVHSFNIESPDEKKPSLKGISQVTTAPEAFQIKFLPRDETFPGQTTVASSQLTSTRSL